MTIYVLAGTNGAGKSSLGGAMIRAAGGDDFNPDEAARQIAQANPGCTVVEANSAAWLEGRRRDHDEVARRCDRGRDRRAHVVRRAREPTSLA